ncbi:MAG: aminopeptidase [Rhodobacteraceae bacterium]|nr:aminopeptidase [Paracoccaceae bacterium]
MVRRLLHTGGTIGMRHGPAGLEPAPGLVEAAVGARASVFAFDPLLDSAAISWRDWNRMLDMVAVSQSPIVITHGTDTMTYTGAALSQCLHGHDVPVILCGSMAPLGAGEDAEENLELALMADPGPGVWLAFNHRLIPAGNIVKHDSRGADAFQAIPQDALDSGPSARRFKDAAVGVLTLTPGTPARFLEAALSVLDAAVLRVFGAGTAPPDPALYRVLSRKAAEGMRLRAVSACETGGLTPGSYAAGAPLWGAGVENGGRDTVEAAFIRLWLALSARA